MPLHHIGINVTDIDAARTFYAAALAPLGYTLKMEREGGSVLGFGTRCGFQLWLTGCNAPAPTPNVNSGDRKTALAPSGPVHIAFTARSRAQVRAFHATAIAAGGKCNGPPGVRAEYMPTYYAAFVLDPEGRNVEAVCLRPAFLAEPACVTGWPTVAALAVLSALGTGIACWRGWI